MYGLASRLGLAFAGLALAAATLYTVARLLPITGEEREAQARLDAALERDGRNAFAALWLLRFDVPDDELEALAAEDVARDRALRQGAPLVDPALDPERHRAAAARFPDLLARVPTNDLCGRADRACLAHVAAEQATAEDVVAAATPLLARLQALSGYDVHRSGFDAGYAAVPPPHAVRLGRVAQALAFVQGEHALAIAGVCTDIATWRRIGFRADSLLMTDYAVWQVDAQLALLADMLVAAPEGVRAPPQCGQALAPPRAEEFALCETMAGEFRHSGALLPPDPPLLDGGLTYDRRKTRARQARQLAWGCSDAARGMIDADVRMSRPTMRWFDFRCIANVEGCMLVAMSDGYLLSWHRMQDARARLLLGATALWLFEQRTAPATDALLAQRPGWMKSAARPVRVATGGDAIEIDLYAPRADRSVARLPVRGARPPG